MAARHACVAIACVLLGLVPRTAHGESGDSELVARKVLIALRVVAYDRALATRVPGDEIVVLVVNAPTASGRVDRDRWLAGFARLPNVKAGGRRVRAQSIELDDPQALDAAIAQRRPALVILGAGLSSEVATIRRITRKHRALSFSLREADVRAGLAIGLAETQSGDQIVINLDAARAEGAKFSAGLLDLVRLVDGGHP